MHFTASESKLMNIFTVSLLSSHALMQSPLHVRTSLIFQLRMTERQSITREKLHQNTSREKSLGHIPTILAEKHAVKISEWD